jgi:hypothetical protein
MTTARRLVLRMALRWQEVLRPSQRDRGDLPGTAIVWAGVAIIAAGLITWATLYITGYLDTAPDATGGGPDAP